MAWLGASSGGGWQQGHCLTYIIKTDQEQVTGILKLAAKWNIIILHLIFRSEPVSRFRILWLRDPLILLQNLRKNVWYYLLQPFSKGTCTAERESPSYFKGCWVRVWADISTSETFEWVCKNQMINRVLIQVHLINAKSASPHCDNFHGFWVLNWVEYT